ncbi:hypothetical protein ACFLYY_02500 [Patescibacteria group bacterium]
MKLRVSFILTILGFLLILINAVDYIADWNKTPGGFIVIGLMLVVVGMFLAKKEKKEK